MRNVRRERASIQFTNSGDREKKPGVLKTYNEEGVKPPSSGPSSGE